MHENARVLWDSSKFCDSFTSHSSPAERQKTRSWPRRTTAAPARSGRGWPGYVTSTPKPANRQRMFPECDPSSSPSNRHLWPARDGERVVESLPLNVNLTPDPVVPSEICPPPTHTMTLYANTLSYDTTWGNIVTVNLLLSLPVMLH